MFSYDPNLSSAKDKVRFLIQDTKENEVFFEDEEINAMLEEFPGYRSCALQLCYTLAALFAGVPDKETVGPYSVDYKSVSNKYLVLAENIRAQINRTLSGYAGGIYKFDVCQTLKNKDLVHTAFKRYMMINYRR